jgi:hypothetical protein
MKFSSKFFWKRSFFDQNQQPLNNVEPFERILRLRALFITQCPYKFSSFLYLRNGSSRFPLFARDFRLFRFFFPGSACFSKVALPAKLRSWVKYDGKFASFGKEFRWTKIQCGGEGQVEFTDKKFFKQIFQTFSTWAGSIRILTGFWLNLANSNSTRCLKICCGGEIALEPAQTQIFPERNAVWGNGLLS